MEMKTRLLKISTILSVFVLAFQMSGCAPSAASDLEEEPLLKFHLVAQDSFGKSPQNADQNSHLPSGTKYYQYEEGSGEFLVTPAFMDENCLADVSAKQHPAVQGSVLNITLTADCAEKFMHVTLDNLGKRFAVVIDENLITAPRINAPIAGGSFFIDFGASDNEAEALADRFNEHINR